MTDPFDAVAEALDVARAAWAGSAAAVDGLTGAGLVALNDAVAMLRRRVDAVHVDVAAMIARASRAELGNAGLARMQGFRTPAALIAATTGGATGEAVRFVTVGEAVAPRTNLNGEQTAPRYPSVAVALKEGRMGVAAAAAIVALLDRIALRVGAEPLAAAEAILVEKSVGLSLDQLQKVLQRAEAWLDPDGVEPRESELRVDRSLHIREDRNGMIHLSARLDPETAAPVKTAIEAIVGAELRHRADPAEGAEGAERARSRDEDRRSIPQLQADALATLCRHLLGCDSADRPAEGATVVVRIDLDALESGRGHALIDGITRPVSVATARRMAAGAALIPCVLGRESEILDFGRSRRLFSPAQKLALIERDGGCAMCGLPPGMTQVHHIRWWARDAGPTDLDNGVLLCVRCHHRIHDDGWGIDVRGIGVEANVWFTPPAHVDPSRSPRLGGRARYDFAA